MKKIKYRGVIIPQNAVFPPPSFPSVERQIKDFIKLGFKNIIVNTGYEHSDQIIKVESKLNRYLKNNKERIIDIIIKEYPSENICYPSGNICFPSENICYENISSLLTAANLDVLIEHSEYLFTNLLKWACINE